MKKMFLFVLLVFLGMVVYAQQLPTVAVARFEPVGVSNDEANVVTELFMAELVNTGTVRVADRANFDKIIAEMRFQLSDWSNDQKTVQLGRALNAEYIIHGQFMKMGNTYLMTATMLNINTAQRLYSAREQFQSLDHIFTAMPNVCGQIANKIPTPNYFIGRWVSGTSIEQLSGRPGYVRLQCEIEFKSDGTLILHRFDTGTTQSGHSGREQITVTGTGTGRYEFNNELLYVQYSVSPRAPVVGGGSGVSYKFDEFKRNLYIYGAFLAFGGDIENNDVSKRYFWQFSKVN